MKHLIYSIGWILLSLMGIFVVISEQSWWLKLGWGIVYASFIVYSLDEYKKYRKWKNNSNKDEG